MFMELGAGRKLLLGLFALLALSHFASGRQVLRWSEEFRPVCKPNDLNCVNGGINLRKFGFELGDGSSYNLIGWGNTQSQCHTNSSTNIRVEPFPNKTSDGYLVIQAAHVPSGHECYNANANASTTYYTSARLTTRGKASFRWTGDVNKSNPIRMDIRMMVPLVDGSWPAASMLPKNNKTWCMGCSTYGDGWCLGGEIDIMGHTNTNNFTHSNVHYGGKPEASWDDCHEKLGTYQAGRRASGWNVISLLWNYNSLKFFANGKLYHEVKMGEWYTGGSQSPYAPFDAPFYLILDMAVGGTVPGFTIDNDAIARGAAIFKVDYIRVYEMVPNQPK